MSTKTETAVGLETATVAVLTEKLSEEHEKERTRLLKGALTLELANSLLREFWDSLAPEESPDLCKWRRREASTGFPVSFLSHGKVTIQLYLGKNDSLDLVKPLLRLLSKSEHLKRISAAEEFLDLEAVDWTYEDVRNKQQILVRVQTYRSEVCRKVKTGRMLPEYKVVCGEESSA